MCDLRGMPAGIGDPVFDKLDADLAKAIFSIGAVKGFEIGDGFCRCLCNVDVKTMMPLFSEENAPLYVKRRIMPAVS